MADHKKRTIDAKQQRPQKKQKRLRENVRDPDNGDEEPAFDAVNLLDSEDDIFDAVVEDAAPSELSDSSSSEDDRSALKKPHHTKRQSRTSSQTALATDKEPKNENADDGEEDDEDDEEDDDVEDEDDDDDDDEEEEEDENGSAETRNKRSKSKRHDPQAFATSISKILSTKLSSSKRADPVLSRSAAAHEASKAATDGALEVKAKRLLREQKRKASEKGRVKDVLMATGADVPGESETSTMEILETERKLQKVALRGIIKLFGEVRKAREAAKAGNTGQHGIGRTQHQETPAKKMSQKGFEELIASGGGGLRKGGLEEA